MQKAKDNPDRLPPWSLSHLWEELRKDLQQCTTAAERMNCGAIAGREIKEKAAEWRAVRKLTPGEESILAAVERGQYPA